MRAERGTWADVHEGSIIRAKDGVVWKVVHGNEHPTHWGLVTRDGDQKIIEKPAKSAPVDIMYLTQDELEEILRTQFGAELEAVRTPDDHIYVVPPWEGRRIDEMKSHLYLFHGVAATSANDPGVSAGMNTVPQLTEAHDHAHAEPNDRWRPHVHTDEETWRRYA